LIPDRDFELLKSFNGHGHVTLSVYLRLDNPQLRNSAYDHFIQEMQACLAEHGSKPEFREALREDMEIVGLYLKTNGHRKHPALAIFSCAAELFWRAYPLKVPVPMRVSVGPKFDVDPLRDLK
jgi:hypothetical protein